MKNHVMNTNDVSIIPELVPPHDPKFALLVEGALLANVDVYYAAVRPSDIVPFSSSFDPEAHPVGRRAVQDVINRWRNNEFAVIWLYDEGAHFITSDDYVVWAAVRRGQPDYVPAYLLGRPEGAPATDLQGPLTLQAVKKALGVE